MRSRMSLGPMAATLCIVLLTCAPQVAAGGSPHSLVRTSGDAGGQSSGAVPAELVTLMLRRMESAWSYHFVVHGTDNECRRCVRTFVITGNSSPARRLVHWYYAEKSRAEGDGHRVLAVSHQETIRTSSDYAIRPSASGPAWNCSQRPSTSLQDFTFVQVPIGRWRVTGSEPAAVDGRRVQRIAVTSSGKVGRLPTVLSIDYYILPGSHRLLLERDAARLRVAPNTYMRNSGTIRFTRFGEPLQIELPNACSH